jgi:hypothetical protein
VSESKALVNWEEKLREEAKAVAVLERPSITTVSLRSGIMSINEQPVPQNKLPCVVVASVFEHVLYTTPFDPNRVVPPDCFALSADGKGMVKHEVCNDNEYGPECATCEMFAWGSVGKIDPRKQGNKGKACKERRRLALIPAAAIEQGEVAKAELAVLSLPVTSLGNWGNYVNSVAAQYGRPFWAMLTEISVVPHVKNQFEVKFNAMGGIADQYLGDVHTRTTSAQEILMQPYDMTPPAEVERQPPRQNTKY